MHTKNGLSRSVAVLLLAVSVGGVSTGVAAANQGQRPVTTTEHLEFPTEVQRDEVCGRQTADITLSDNKLVIHTTEFADGRVHVTGTFRSSFSWVQDGVTYSGKVTGWFGENVNRNNVAATFTLSGQGKGSDGSKVSVKGLAHYSESANGAVTAFERFSVTCR